MKILKNIIIISLGFGFFQACSPADGENTGHEYMPDMAHSVAYEANVYNYYYYNTWDSVSTFKLKELSNPRKPVKGTVPRGFAGISFADDAEMKLDVMGTLRGGDAVNSIAVPVNGNVPYYYDDSDAERERAIREIINNPYPITEQGLAKAKDLYNIYCGICHGEKGDGGGYLVSEDNKNSKYQAAPANFLLPEFVAASNGRYYHSIMFGKNVMGGYADKLSYEERWQVIHYIRSLQATELKLEYSASANTLNDSFGIPADQLRTEAELMAANSLQRPEATTSKHEEEDHEEDEGHNNEEHH